MSESFKILRQFIPIGNHHHHTLYKHNFLQNFETKIPRCIGTVLQAAKILAIVLALCTV